MGRSRGHGSKHGKSGRHHGQRVAHSKAQSPPPGSAALELRLVAEPDFHEAVSGRGCPANFLEDDGTDTPGLRLSLANWSDLDLLLSWYKAGAAQDSSAYLKFASELQKEHREEIHRLADKMGLESVSRGVGPGRHISVGQKGFAPAKEEMSEEQKTKADRLYLYAMDAGVAVSRDEVAEVVSSGQLTGELQSLWEGKSAEQEALVRLNTAASRGKVQELREAIDASPEVVKKGVYELKNRLAPLHCAAAHGHADALQALIDAGAPLGATDGFGNTALQAARKFEQQDTEALLLRAGAKDQGEERNFAEDVSLEPKNEAAAAAESSTAAPSGRSMEQAVGAKPFVPSPAKAPQAGASSSLEHAFDAKPFVPQAAAAASKANNNCAEADVGKRGPGEGWEGGANEKRAKVGVDRQSEVNRTSEDAVAGSFPSGGTAAVLPETEFPPLPSGAAAGDESQEKEEQEATEVEPAGPKASHTYAAVASKGAKEEGKAAQAPTDQQGSAAERSPKPEDGKEREQMEGGKGAARAEGGESAGNGNATAPPIISLAQLKVPAVGGRTLSDTVEQLSKCEGDTRPDLQGDKRTATRGRPGASAMALGRRIIENANADRHRHIPTGEKSARNGPRPVEAEKKVDITVAAKPRAPRRREEDEAQKRNNRVQDWMNGQEGPLEDEPAPELPDIDGLDPSTISPSAAVEAGKGAPEGVASWAAVAERAAANVASPSRASTSEPTQAHADQEGGQHKDRPEADKAEAPKQPGSQSSAVEGQEKEQQQQGGSVEDPRGLTGGYQEATHPPAFAPPAKMGMPAIVGGAAVAEQGQPTRTSEDSHCKGKAPEGLEAGVEDPRALKAGFAEATQPPAAGGNNDKKVADILAVVGGRRVPGQQPTKSTGIGTYKSAPDLAGDPRVATWGKPAKPVHLPGKPAAGGKETSQEKAAGQAGTTDGRGTHPPAAASSNLAHIPGTVGGTGAEPRPSSTLGTLTESEEPAAEEFRGPQSGAAGQSAVAEKPSCQNQARAGVHAEVQPSTQETERKPAFAEEAPAVHPPSPRAAEEAKAAETQAGKQLHEEVAAKGLAGQDSTAKANAGPERANGKAEAPGKEGLPGPKGLGSGLPAARPGTARPGARSSAPTTSQASLKEGDSLVYAPPKSVFAGKGPVASGQVDAEAASEKGEASGSASRPSGRLPEHKPSINEIEPASPSAPSKAKLADDDWDDDDEEGLLESIINWAQANQTWVFGGIAVAAVATAASFVVSSWRK